MTRTAILADWKAAAETLRSAVVRPRHVLITLALLYFVAAATSAWSIIDHSQASTKAIENILSLYNEKNEAAQTLARYGEKHPFLGFLFGGTVEHELQLPAHQEAVHALYTEVTKNLETVRLESHVAAWWSWFLISLSLAYTVAVVSIERSLTTRAVLFSLTTITVVCFVVGIFAPAMVVWTTPVIPMESGNFEYVVQYQVRGIAAIIWDLLTGNHWIIGGFLLLFSIVTPLTKASLTFFITACPSRSLNRTIGEFLHTIGKWSMADVFVAAILLALYALKFQQATKSVPCIGLYYFIGYCLLSMTTTELVVHSGAVAASHERSEQRKLPPSVIVHLFAVLIAFIAASSLYTYEQYTANLKQRVPSSPSPTQQLNNSNLVLPAHK